MTKIIRVSPALNGAHPAWQLEIDDVCMLVLSSRAAALEAAQRIIDKFKDAGVPCDAVLSTDARPVRIAA